MFQFVEGKAVILKVDNPALDLDAGTTGVVWALYDTLPPSYEVSFTGKDGLKFDVTMSEEELTVPIVKRELAGLGQNHQF